MRVSLLIKAAAALIVVATVGVLFVRSAISTRAEPYSTRPEWLRQWRVVEATPASASEPVLALEGPREFASDLFRQVFSRSGDSLSGPTTAAIPLLLKGEFDRTFAGHATTARLAAAARESGLESEVLRPRCLGFRRISAPGVTRQLYFVLFEVPVLARFREGLLQLRPQDGLAATGYDPAALSPILIVAATDQAFGTWLPLRADPAGDCLAPLAVQ